MLWRSPSLPYRTTPYYRCPLPARPTADVRRCRSTALPGLGRQPDRVDERRECRGYLAPPRVIEKEAGKRRAPILEHSRERPSLEQGRNLVLDHVREAHTGQRGVDDHVLVIEHERPVDAHLHFVVALLEFPLVDRARCR